jgi:hypothetical protein
MMMVALQQRPDRRPAPRELVPGIAPLGDALAILMDRIARRNGLDSWPVPSFDPSKMRVDSMADRETQTPRQLAADEGSDWSEWPLVDSRHRDGLGPSPGELAEQLEPCPS